MRFIALASLVMLAAAAPAVPVTAQSTQQDAVPAAETATTAGTANPDDQRIRCRRMGTTGSLVRRERVCKTVGEWRRLGDRGNDTTRELMQDAARCASGCGGG